MLCHVNKSAFKRAKSDEAVADFDQSMRGICLCSEQRVGYLWPLLLLSDEQKQPVWTLGMGCSAHGGASCPEQSCQQRPGNIGWQMRGSRDLARPWKETPLLLLSECWRSPKYHLKCYLFPKKRVFFSKVCSSCASETKGSTWSSPLRFWKRLCKSIRIFSLVMVSRRSIINRLF